MRITLVERSLVVVDNAGQGQLVSGLSWPCETKSLATLMSDFRWTEERLACD